LRQRPPPLASSLYGQCQPHLKKKPAALWVHLDNERSGFVTGANFVIDGGATRKMINEPE